MIAREYQERGPIRSIGMAAGMLPERYVAIHQSGFDGREFGGAQILLAEQFIYLSLIHI